MRASSCATLNDDKKENVKRHEVHSLAWHCFLTGTQAAFPMLTDVSVEAITEKVSFIGYGSQTS